MRTNHNVSLFIFITICVCETCGEIMLGYRLYVCIPMKENIPGGVWSIKPSGILTQKQLLIHNHMAVACYDANILLMAFSFHVFDIKFTVIVSIECLERLFSVLKLPTKKQRGVTYRYFSCMSCTLRDILIKRIYIWEPKRPLIFHTEELCGLCRSPVLMIVKSGEVQ
jgi:hypothetical protein